MRRIKPAGMRLTQPGRRQARRSRNAPALGELLLVQAQQYQSIPSARVLTVHAFLVQLGSTIAPCRSSDSSDAPSDRLFARASS